MSYLDFVVLAVPALIGLAGPLTLGTNRGTLLAAPVMLVTVFVLLLFQVSVPRSGPGADVSRFSYAWGLLWFEWFRWAPAFAIGAAVGALIRRFTRRSPQA